ncbi:MAG: phytanoyl-CoA dioxygenase family protein [Chitinophagales bacterium]
MAKRSFYSSSEIEDAAYSNQLTERLQELVWPFVQAFVPQYDLFTASALWKFPGEKGTCTMHCDWSIIDEKKYTPLHVWLPITDVNAGNGTLFLAPGSFNYTGHYRGYGIPEPQRKHYHLLRSKLIPVEEAAGAGVFYHPGNIHFSPPNYSTEVRLAVLLSCFPKIASPELFCKGPFDFFGIRRFPLSRKSFQQWNKRTMPNWKSTGKVFPDITRVSAETLLSKMDSCI